jgi:hypothetical protein
MLEYFFSQTARRLVRSVEFCEQCFEIGDGVDKVDGSRRADQLADLHNLRALHNLKCEFPERCGRLFVPQMLKVKHEARAQDEGQLGLLLDSPDECRSIPTEQ